MPEKPAKPQRSTPERIPIRSSDAAGSLADTARRFGEEGFGAKGGLKDLLAQFADSAKTPMSDAVKAMQQQWTEQAQALRQIQTESLIRPLPYLPSAEVTASRAIETQTARLVDISIRTGEQIGQLAQLAEAALKQQVQTVLTTDHMREDAKKSSRTLTWLTIAIVILTAGVFVLTYVVAAQSLQWWPFLPTP